MNWWAHAIAQALHAFHPPVPPEESAYAGLISDTPKPVDGDQPWNPSGPLFHWDEP